jgi:catechol 2,3-dioxygenase-like lactoylglutathione lyase family enzyme
MQPTDILETCLYVDDLDRAERFYGTVLGLPCIARQHGRHVFFRCGPRMLLIFDPTGVGREDSETPAHGARGPSHIAFAVAESDLPAWQQHLHAHRVEIEKTVDWPQGGRSIYFRDPAGNSLELATPQIWNGVEL